MKLYHSVPFPKTFTQYYTLHWNSCSVKVSIWQFPSVAFSCIKLNMGSSHSLEKPLLYTSANNDNHTFCCFKDNTFPPQFQDVDVIRIVSRQSELQNAEIKENFSRLSESINKVLKEEYELKDRKSLNKKLNMIIPIYQILFCAYIILFLVIFIGRFFGFNPMNWALQTLLAIFLLPLFLSFVLGVTEKISGKKKMDERLILKIDSQVKDWNSSCEHDSVYAVHEWEGGGSSSRRIPQCLKLFEINVQTTNV